MKVARAKGRLRGRQPKLSVKQQTELRRMRASGDYTISDLAELFTISRPTVYRTLKRDPPSTSPPPLSHNAATHPCSSPGLPRQWAALRPHQADAGVPGIGPSRSGSSLQRCATQLKAIMSDIQPQR